MGFVILADPSTPGPSDQGSPSSVAPEVPVVSDTLPVIPSIQPINVRAPSDEDYEEDWNPIWEPDEDATPVTPPSVLSLKSTSHMDETSSSTGETPVVSNVDTPIPATSPLPPRYQSLRDRVAARTPATAMWDPHVTPTTGPFVSQPHTTLVTSVPTNPTVCVAHSTPVISAVTASSSTNTGVGHPHGQVSSGQPELSPRVVDPAQSAPSSSGPVPGGGPYDAYGQAVQDPNVQGPLFYYNSTGQYLQYSRTLPLQPFVEVSVPLSIAWDSSTHSFHGGQAIPAQLQGPPNQGQPPYVQAHKGSHFMASLTQDNRGPTRTTLSGTTFGRWRSIVYLSESNFWLSRETWYPARLPVWTTRTALYPTRPTWSPAGLSLWTSWANLYSSRSTNSPTGVSFWARGATLRIAGPTHCSV